jgi:hypothetical protein
MRFPSGEASDSAVGSALRRAGADAGLGDLSCIVISYTVRTGVFLLLSLSLTLGSSSTLSSSDPGVVLLGVATVVTTPVIGYIASPDSACICFNKIV